MVVHHSINATFHRGAADRIAGDVIISSLTLLRYTLQSCFKEYTNDLWGIS